MELNMFLSLSLKVFTWKKCLIKFAGIYTVHMLFGSVFEQS